MMFYAVPRKPDAWSGQKVRETQKEKNQKEIWASQVLDGFRDGGLHSLDVSTRPFIPLPRLLHSQPDLSFLQSYHIIGTPRDSIHDCCHVYGDGTKSTRIPLRRGLVQGCPLSPISYKKPPEFPIPCLGVWSMIFFSVKNTKRKIDCVNSRVIWCNPLFLFPLMFMVTTLS